MEKRLIPYSVHLPEDVFLLVKKAAGERKAAGLIREAIVSFVGQRDLFDKGYSAGLEAAMKKVANNKLANAIAYDQQTMADIINKDLEKLIK